MADRIDVDARGLREFLIKVSALDALAPAALRDAGSQAASDVAPTARARVPIGPALGGHVATSVRAVGPTVRMGGPEYPYAGWLEYGGRVGRRHLVTRERVPGGRYLYPSYVQHVTEIDAALSRQLSEMIAEAGLE